MSRNAGGCFTEMPVVCDGYVDVNDVLYVISAWDTADPNADFDGDGLVDADDVLILLSHFGENCP